MPHTFETILDTPESYSANHVLVRLVDGLGFRFYWATKGLEEADFQFRPAMGLMSIEELISHIEDLCFMSYETFSVENIERTGSNPQDSITSALSFLSSLKDILLKLEDMDLNEYKIKGFPIWNLINGPLADALTHVGQINSYRRMNGNPCPNVSVFIGKPKSSRST